MHTSVKVFALIAVTILSTFLLTPPAHSDPSAASAKARVFEIRTYTTEKGKLPDLLKRFRDHTTRLFEKHGMTNIGYWIPADEPRSQDTLIYILAHDSRDAAKKSWAAFRSDPEWTKVRTASEANGKIVAKTESVFANPADFSAIK
jgi:NIPSNAP